VTLKKGFLKPQNNLSQSKRQLISGFIFGLLSALILYFSSQFVFESFRRIAAHFEGLLYVFTENEMSFFNWFYASVSLVFGNAIFLRYWAKMLCRTNDITLKNKLRIHTIKNDQTNLTTYFFHWFARCALLYFLFFGLNAGHWSYDVIGLYENYKYFFILIPIVLWLNSWLGISRLFRKKSLLWMAFSAMFIIVLSFGLSKIDFSNSKNFNKTFLEKNLINKYEFHLPQSDLWTRFEKRSRIITFHIGYEKKNPKKPTIIFENYIVYLPDIHKIIYHRLQEKDMNEIPYMTAIITADKRIPMSFIDSFKNELQHSNFVKIGFSTQTSEANSRIPQSTNRGLEIALPYLESPKYLNVPPPPLPPHENSRNQIDNIIIEEELVVMEKSPRAAPPPPPPPCFACYSNQINVYLEADGTTILNGKKTSLDSLAPSISRLIAQNSDYVIGFSYDTSCTLDQYITIATALRQSVYYLRDLHSNELYGKDHKKIRDDELRLIRKKYPLRIQEPRN
jgi:biopolymer transport protein ExbD